MPSSDFRMLGNDDKRGMTFGCPGSRLGFYGKSVSQKSLSFQTIPNGASGVGGTSVTLTYTGVFAKADSTLTATPRIGVLTGGNIAAPATKTWAAVTALGSTPSNSDLKTTIENIRTNQVLIQWGIGEVKKDIDNMRTNITTLYAEIVKIRTDLRKVAADLATLKNGIGSTSAVRINSNFEKLLEMLKEYGLVKMT